MINANPVLTALLQRRSNAATRLQDPAPNDEALKQILQAGLTAPDHGRLRPWRCLVIRADARLHLAELYAAGLVARNPAASAEEIDAQRQKPLRAPLIIAVAAKIQLNHPKVPTIEQILAAGCAAQQMQLAAQSLGYGSVWLTGPNVYSPEFRQALTLDDSDVLIGLLHLGSLAPDTGHTVTVERPQLADHVQEWLAPGQTQPL